MVLIISVMASTPDRTWLASAVERVDRRFLDRLHTLLYLEQRRSERPAAAFAVRIARQAQSILTAKPSPAAFSGRTALKWFAVFLLVTGVVFYLNQSWAP